jgi:mRNA interferase MazF
MISRGDLHWLVTGDDRGAIPEIPHPYVVVQEDVFNQSRVPTVIVCALSSNLQKAHEPGNVLLDEGEGDLEKRSVVVVSQLSSVDKTKLGARIGRLSAERVQQILAGIRFQQAAYFREG